MTTPSYRFSTTIRVRWGECDAFGHVNNASYLSYFEEARIDYWKAVAQGGDPAQLRLILGAQWQTLDDEFAFAIRDHGLKVQWAFPPDLARSARRNPGYTADPYELTLAPLAPVERDADKLIAEPLAGQLRTFTGLFNARYALVPVELALVPDGPGGRAALHVVIVDTRAARIMWKGDISSDGVRNFSPAIAAGVAGRLADLFTPAR